MLEDFGAWNGRAGLRRRLGLLGGLGRKGYWAGLCEKLGLLEGLGREDSWEDLSGEIGLLEDSRSGNSSGAAVLDGGECWDLHH